jgi:long-chain acyl-CoA synthetase
MGKMAPTLPAERRTIHRLLKQSESTWGHAPALYQPVGQGRYRTYNWIDYRRIAEEVAAGLRTLGVTRGDIAGLASETRAEFYLADVGIMTNGSIAAAVYTSLPHADQVKTLKACYPKVVFVENARTLQALDAAGLASLDIPRILLSGESANARPFGRLL